MDPPGVVSSALDDGERIAASVELGGDDSLFVTQSRTLVYRSEGLLSDESIEQYDHAVERVELSEGRRSATLHLDYGREGQKDMSIPTNSVEEVLHPVLAGILNANDVTAAGETTTRTYRFSELTLVVTSQRVVKHVSNAVWDGEYDDIAYEDVTGLAVEDGSVSSQLVLEMERRTERIKVPNESLGEIREDVEAALCGAHGVSTYEEFEATSEPAVDGTAQSGEPSQTAPDDQAEPFAASGLEPIQVEHSEEDSSGSPSQETTGEQTATPETAGEPAADSESVSEPSENSESEQREPETASSSGSGFEESGFESATTANADRAELVDLIESLEETITAQREILDEQQQCLDALAAELSRDQ